MSTIILYDVDGTSVDPRTSYAMDYAKKKYDALQGLNTNTSRPEVYSIQTYGESFGKMGIGFYHLYSDMQDFPVLFNNNYFFPHSDTSDRWIGPEEKYLSMVRVQLAFPNSRVILLDDLDENINFLKFNGMEAKKIYGYVVPEDIDDLFK